MEPAGVPPLGVVVRSKTGPSYRPLGTACISAICQRKQSMNSSAALKAAETSTKQRFQYRGHSISVASDVQISLQSVLGLQKVCQFSGSTSSFLRKIQKICLMSLPKPWKSFGSLTSLMQAPEGGRQQYLPHRHELPSRTTCSYLTFLRALMRL